jgi:hypothetical protein
MGGGDQFIGHRYVNEPWVDGGLTVDYGWSSASPINLVAQPDGKTIEIQYTDAAGQTVSDTALFVSLFRGTVLNDQLDLRQFTSNHVGERWALFTVTGGSDTVWGNGSTTLSLAYNQSSNGAGASIDLAAGEADLSHLKAGSAAFGRLKYSDIASAHGGPLADTLTGNQFGNTLRGMAGDDVLDGRSGFDTASYRNSTGPIHVRLADGIVSGNSSVGTDTLKSIELIQGSYFDDLYDARGFSNQSANASSDTALGGTFNHFRDLGGNDQIIGNGNTAVEYATSMVGIHADLGQGFVDARLESDKLRPEYLTLGRDTLVDVYRVRGSALDDLLIGGGKGRTAEMSSTIEMFDPGAGDDTIDGRGGWDIVGYWGAPAGISLDLSYVAGQVIEDGYGGTDTLIGVERVSGSAFADTMLGSQTNDGLQFGVEMLEGLAGDDRIAGRGGLDFAAYYQAPAGVKVWLDIGSVQASQMFGTETIEFRGRAEDGYGTIDLLSGIEGIEGSAHDDSLYGSAADEHFSGREGNDLIDGGAGSDWARYNHAAAGVEVDLALGTAKDGLGGTDTLISIEHVRGSDFGDRLIGNAGNNSLQGRDGNDTLIGGAGFDTAVYRGARSDYDIRANADGSWTVRDLRAAPSFDAKTGEWSVHDGIDTISEIESLQFADGTQSPVGARFSGNGHYYDLVTEAGSWSSALQKAALSSYRGMSGYLATLTSAAENQFVFSVFSGALPSHKTIWLGATDQTEEGVWRWASGPETGQLLTYTNWGGPVVPSEPNNGNGSPYFGPQHYLALPLSWGGRWDDGWEVAPEFIGDPDLYAGYVIEYGGLPPSYTITPSATTVNEGETITFTIDTVNVEWGTEIAYTLSGISAADLAAGSMTGTAIVQPNGIDGRATVTLSLKADSLTEGNESLTIQVGELSSSVAVLDSSTRPPVEVRFASLTASTINAEFWIDAGMALENFDFALSLLQPSAFALSSAPLSIDVASFSGWNGFLEPSPGTAGEYLMSAFTGSLNPVTDPPNPIRFASFQVNRLASADSLQIALKDLILNSTSVAGVALFEMPLSTTVSISSTTTSVAESAPAASRKMVFDVQLDQALLTTESLSWALERLDSTEAMAIDFDSAVQGSISLAAGQIQARIEVTIKDDAIVEADERFQLRLSQASAGLRLAANSVSVPVTIVDDDRSLARLEPVTASPIVEGNAGSTVYAFEIVLDQAPVSAQTVSWSVMGSGAAAADGADFQGGALPSGTASFAAGQTRQRVEVRIAGDTLAEANESFTVQLNAASSRVDLSSTQRSLSATIQSDDGVAVNGRVYHWKNHALLSDVMVMAMQQPAASAGTSPPLFELRAARMDPSGTLSAELWARPASASQTLDLSLQINQGMELSFERDTTSLSASWWVESNVVKQPGATELLLSGAVASETAALTAAARLGTIRIATGTAATALELDFAAGTLGTQLLTPYTLAAHTDRTAGDGVIDLGMMQPGAYTLMASKALTTGETGGAILSSDALAALRMSVGLNPNADPDGTGPQSAPLVSPYQFIAADVNGDGRVNSADALGILKMAVKRSDAPAREWLFVDEGFDFWNEAANSGKGAFTTTRTNISWDKEPDMMLGSGSTPTSATHTSNLIAILKGDVNGSWSAPAGSSALPDSYFHMLAAANPLGMHINQFGLAPVL